MYNGPFSQFNPFAPFSPTSGPVPTPAFFHGFNGGFTPQFIPQFAFFQGATQTPWNGGAWAGPTNQNQFPAQYPGQYAGQSAYPLTPSGWNPVVTQTSDGFFPGGTQFGGFATGPNQTSAGFSSANFTPYSYQQPFFPGFNGTTGSSFPDQTINQRFNTPGTPNFGPGGPWNATQNGVPFFGGLPTFGQWSPQNFVGSTFTHQPTFAVNSAWYPTSSWQGTPAFTPNWNGANAFNAFGGGYLGASSFNPYAAGPYTTNGCTANGYPTNGYQPFGGFSGTAYPSNSFGTPGYGTNGQGPSVFNGSTAFPFVANSTPGFPVWNQTANGFPFYGSPAGPFPGSFSTGASAQGWFPGQATFPWYSQVNVAPTAAGSAPVNLRPVDTGDSAANTQQPRGIQFNRDAA